MRREKKEEEDYEVGIRDVCGSGGNVEGERKCREAREQKKGPEVEEERAPDSR